MAQELPASQPVFADTTEAKAKLLELEAIARRVNAEIASAVAGSRALPAGMRPLTRAGVVAAATAEGQAAPNGTAGAIVPVRRDNGGVIAGAPVSTDPQASRNAGNANPRGRIAPIPRFAPAAAQGMAAEASMMNRAVKFTPGGVSLGGIATVGAGGLSLKFARMLGPAAVLLGAGAIGTGASAANRDIYQYMLENPTASAGDMFLTGASIAGRGVQRTLSPVAETLVGGTLGGLGGWISGNIAGLGAVAFGADRTTAIETARDVSRAFEAFFGADVIEAVGLKNSTREAMRESFREARMQALDRASELLDKGFPGKLSRVERDVAQDLRRSLEQQYRQEAPYMLAGLKEHELRGETGD